MSAAWRYMTVVVCLMSLLMVPGVLFSQDYETVRRDLQRKQSQTRAEIDDLKKMLQGYQDAITKTSARSIQLDAEYKRLELEIAVRRQIKEKLRQESENLKREIALNQQEFAQYEAALNEMIEQYKRTLTYVYKQGKVDELLILLTSGSLNQLLVRSFYLRKFAAFREKQAAQLKEAQEELKIKEAQLQQSRQRNLALTKESEAEEQQLNVKLSRQKEVIAALQRDRRKLQDQLAQTRKNIDNLTKTLDKLIAAELDARKKEEERIKALEAERLRRLAEAEKITDNKVRAEQMAKYSKPILRPGAISDEQLKLIEQSFLKQKGKLPWPVESGVIASKFGNVLHPIYRTTTYSPGIVIASEERTPVFAIHEGYVTSIFPIVDYGDVVLVSHGKYYTVYGNLSEVAVSKNDVVRVGDMIGKSGDSNSPKGAGVFLMVREDKNNVNPELWISKK